MNKISSIGNDPIENFSLVGERISKYLSSYKEFKCFNVRTPEEASIYLVAEEHSDEKSHTMNASLINYIASQGHVIVLHEGLESGEILGEKYKDAMINVRHLNPSYKNNITFVGWDVSEEVIRSVGTPEHVLSRIANKIREFENKSHTLFQEINEIAPGIISDRLDIKVEFQIYITLEKDKCQLISDLIIELGRINRIVIEGMQKYNALKANPIKEDAIDKTFPQRIEAMVSTLRRIDKIRQTLGVGNAKVVLIGGINQLKTDKEDMGNPNYDLSTLYAELEKHKSAILIPPHIWE